MKYYLIAGEASGDLHGSNLMKALKTEDPKADFRFWGGDLMAEQGGTPVKHYRDLAFMGFVEVLFNLRTILGNISFCKKDVLTYAPDVLILIDYPGFNLRIAKWAKAQGIRVFYYISPQIWAWHSSRVHGIKATVDRMFVILPFEADFYAKYDYEADFVGHPLLDVVQQRQPDPRFRSEHQLSDAPIIALLPGSRKQEIQRLLPIVLAVVPQFPDHQFIIAGAPAQTADYYHDIIAQSKLTKEQAQRIHLIENQTYEVLLAADLAVVASGTATLETALFDVPQVVTYKGSWLSYHIAKRLVNVQYISLVNLIVDRPIVRELIQHECSPTHLTDALRQLLQPAQREQVQANYHELRELLGHAGASDRAARLMVGYLRQVER